MLSLLLLICLICCYDENALVYLRVGQGIYFFEVVMSDEIKFIYRGQTFTFPADTNQNGALIDVDAFIKIEKELVEAKETIKHLREKAEFDMPVDMQGKHFNACNDSCDMIDGPCACGAWHSAKEWIEKLSKKLNTAKEENQSFGNVLAVLHRDGGHYIIHHGHKKASEDAINMIYEMRTQLTETKEQ